ncbi:ribonuclease P protein component [Leucobacter weissii]|uniref:Ribonuclease P protein component n=1 Tax=Leucobacter weissii TaxID=1983706 RepID=A0A939MIB5_9MICO|nr:ribonuclease P protein component [Leucobacter weissii]
MPARQHRITRGDDYRRVVRGGARSGGAYCVMHVNAREDPSAPARFGFIVSKAVGNAVTRNLVRRRMKAVADHALQQGCAGADVVIRALPASAAADFGELQHEILRLLAKLHRQQDRRVRS